MVGCSECGESVPAWLFAGHFLVWQREAFAVRPQDRSAQLTTLSFDVVQRDIFLPLVSGATLVLPSADFVDNPDQLPRWLARERITMMCAVPALAQFWLEERDEIVLPELRVVFFAGEPLTDTLVERWRQMCPNCTVANLYSPAEVGLAKCCYVVPQHPQRGVQPIGRPLPATQTLVLNEYGDFLSDMASGLIGSIGTGASGNFSFTDDDEVDIAMFDPSGGTAPDIAGQNKCNPTAILLAFGMLLDHIDHYALGHELRLAIFACISEGQCTADIGGALGTREFTGIILDRLKDKI